MPRLWSETIDEHRRAVRETIVETTAALVARDGLGSVTMSRVAAEAGIGRATLYKYFPDVASILAAWHQELITSHLEQLAEVRDRPGDAVQRLRAVLETYAQLSRGGRGGHDAELTAWLHRDHQVAAAQQRVQDMIEDLVVAGADAGALRGDVPPRELARYCLHAVGAAASTTSKAAVRRLVGVILAGLGPPS